MYSIAAKDNVDLQQDGVPAKGIIDHQMFNVQRCHAMPYRRRAMPGHAAAARPPCAGRLSHAIKAAVIAGWAAVIAMPKAAIKIKDFQVAAAAAEVARKRGKREEKRRIYAGAQARACYAMARCTFNDGARCTKMRIIAITAHYWSYHNIQQQPTT